MITEKDKLLGAIGLCAKARKFAYGADSVKRSMDFDAAWLVIADKSASEGQRDRIRSICENYEVPYYELETELDVAYAAGKDTCKFFAVEDENLAKLITAKLEAFMASENKTV